MQNRATGKTVRRRTARMRARHRKWRAFWIAAACLSVVGAGAFAVNAARVGTGQDALELPEPPVLTHDEVHQRLGAKFGRLRQAVERARHEQRRGSVPRRGEDVRSRIRIPAEIKAVLEERERRIGR